MKTLAVLGCTGSIGRNVLGVVRSFGDRFRVAGLAAGRNVALLAEQMRDFRPEVVAVASRREAEGLRSLLGSALDGVRLVWGESGLEEVAAWPGVDMVVTAVVGAVGLRPTLAAIDEGRAIGLANKETLVMGGALVMARAEAAGVPILPIDSEHSAIFQALEAGRRQDVARIILKPAGKTVSE